MVTKEMVVCKKSTYIIYLRQFPDWENLTGGKMAKSDEFLPNFWKAESGLALDTSRSQHFSNSLFIQLTAAYEQARQTDAAFKLTVSKIP